MAEVDGVAGETAAPQTCDQRWRWDSEMMERDVLGVLDWSATMVEMKKTHLSGCLLFGA